MTIANPTGRLLREYKDLIQHNRLEVREHPEQFRSRMETITRLFLELVDSKNGYFLACCGMMHAHTNVAPTVAMEMVKFPGYNKVVAGGAWAHLQQEISAAYTRFSELMASDLTDDDILLFLMSER